MFSSCEKLRGMREYVQMYNCMLNTARKCVGEYIKVHILWNGKGIRETLEREGDAKIK